jgi:hypothetical protein
MSKLSLTHVVLAVGIGLVVAIPAASADDKVGGVLGGTVDLGAEMLADKPDITGNYKLNGSSPDGSKYTGVASITKIGGEMYNATWTIGTKVYKGIAFRDGDLLSCGWSDKASGARDLGVIAYLVKPDNSLDGVWFESGGTVLGTEYLIGGSKTLVGKYTVKTGVNPDKSKYTGTVAIELVNGVYQLNWKLGTANIKGLGLRNGDVLSAAFSDNGGAYGVLQYRITDGGKTLTGTFAQSGKNPSLGAETMTKK